MHARREAPARPRRLRTPFRRVLCALVAFGVAGAAVTARADLRDPAAWEVLAARNTLLDVVAWNDALVAAMDGGGVFVFDPADDGIDVLDTTDGLSSLRAQVLATDAVGRLWVGTADAGVIRIDPSGATRTITGLAQQIDVRALAVDGDFVYYGGPQGAGSITAGLAEQTFTTENGLPSDDVREIAAVDGRAYIATAAGVAVFDRAANQLSVLDDGLPSLDVLSIHADPQFVVAGTAAGLVRLDEQAPGGPAWVPFSPALGVRVRDVTRFADRWAVLGQGNEVHTLASANAAWVSQDATGIRSNAITFDDAGELWIAGARLDADALASDPTPLLRTLDGRRSPFTRGLFGSNVRSIALDGAGGVWVGGFPVFDGVTHWRADGRVVVYAESDVNGPGWMGGTKNAMVVTDDGDVWVSTFTSGVTRMRPTAGDDVAAATYLHLTPDESPLRSRRIRAMEIDPKGRIWFASSGEEAVGDLNVGIDILLDPSDPSSPSSWMKITPSNSLLAGDGIWSLDFEGDDVVWITVEREGLQRWDYDAALGTGDVEPSALTTSLAWDLIEFLPETASGAEISRPRDVAIAPDGRLWLGTQNEGLFRFLYDDFVIGSGAVDRFSRTRSRSPFMTDAIRAVEVDDRGGVWAATEVGLQRVRIEGDVATVEAWTDVPGFLAFDLGSRFLPEILSPIAGSDLLRLRFDPGRGLLYVGSSRGLSRIALAAETSGSEGGIDALLRPNPVRRAEELYIDGFEGEADVEVYTLAGVLVHTARGVRAGELMWDTLNISGERVVSGLYVVRVSQGDQVQLLTLAVER